jgi:antitoxin component YwqK of YwqJK toxin-antitoxin module
MTAISPKPEPTADAGLVEHVERHRDGSVRARGQYLDGELHGYWVWFRLDGTAMRSGHFDRGRKVGEWTTYDRAGVAYKVTTMKG